MYPYNHPTGLSHLLAQLLLFMLQRGLFRMDCKESCESPTFQMTMLTEAFSTYQRGTSRTAIGPDSFHFLFWRGRAVSSVFHRDPRFSPCILNPGLLWLFRAGFQEEPENISRGCLLGSTFWVTETILHSRSRSLVGGPECPWRDRTSKSRGILEWSYENTKYLLYNNNVSYACRVMCSAWGPWTRCGWRRFLVPASFLLHALRTPLTRTTQLTRTRHPPVSRRRKRRSDRLSCSANFWSRNPGLSRKTCSRGLHKKFPVSLLPIQRV